MEVSHAGSPRLVGDDGGLFNRRPGGVVSASAPEPHALSRRTALRVAAAAFLSAIMLRGDEMTTPQVFDPAPAPIPPTPADYTFADEFSGPAGSPPDPAKWVHITGPGATVGGNNETETYTADTANAYQDGQSHLVIAVTSPSVGVLNSARLVTQGKFSQQYGSWEASIAVQNTLGCWPAAWFLGVNQAWPACGEIDMMENYGTGFTDGTVWNALAIQKSGGKSADPCDGNFHVYRMEYSENEISLFRDGEQYVAALRSELDPWPFNDNGGVYMLLNIATGGSGTGNQNPASSALPARMLVDYVHAWR